MAAQVVKEGEYTTTIYGMVGLLILNRPFIVDICCRGTSFEPSTLLVVFKKKQIKVLISFVFSKA